MSMAFRFEPTTHSGTSYDDCRAYNVWRATDSLGVLGRVESNRTESWRHTSSGVRYSKRGSPKSWSAYRAGGVLAGRGYRTRQAAAEALAAM